MRLVLISAVLALTLACKKESPPPAEEAAAAPTKPAPKAAEKVPEKTAVAEAPKPADEGPQFKLDDARLTKFMEFQSELQKLHADALERIKEKSKAGGPGALAALEEPKKVEDAVKALEAKYGFSDEEQQWINDLITEVTLGGGQALGVDELKKQLKAEAAKGGPAGEEAAKAIKDLEEQTSKNLDEAKAKYGADAVSLVQKRAGEISAFRTKLLKGVK